MKSLFHNIDLFAGCGGLMDGFERNPLFSTLACVEWEVEPCNTLRQRLRDKYKKANADDVVVRFDMQRTDELFAGFDDVDFGSNPGLDTLVGEHKIDFIIGGPPCQAYSIAGRIRDEHGMKNDYRNYLFESYVKVVSHFRPQFFVFENVQGMLSAAPDGEPITSKIRKAFNEIGYEIPLDLKKCVFDVSDYGLPQHRKRVIIIGIDTHVYNEFEQTAIFELFYHCIRMRKCSPLTVDEAIGDLPPIYPLKSASRESGRNFSHSPFASDIPNHVPRFHNLRDIETFRMLAEDIETGTCEYVSTEKLKELYTKLTGKKSNIHKYYVLRRNEPSNTIPAHLYKDGMRHIHPDSKQARSITVREAARLQTFDDDYIFTGSMGAQYKMIGNAVPPKFAEILSSALAKVITTLYHE